MVAVTEKACTKCGVTKPLEAFGSDKRRELGRQSDCRDCKATSARERDWTKRGIPTSEWPDLHRKAIHTSHMRGLAGFLGGKWCPSCFRVKTYGEFNANASSPDGLKGQCRACQGKYYADNAEVIRERSAVYYTENREAIREYGRSPAGRDANRRSREKRGRAPTCRNALTYALELLEDADLFECFWCSGELDSENTHIDHVHPLSRKGTGYGPNLVFACGDCNLTKNARPTFAFTVETVADLHGVDISGHAPAELEWSSEELEGWPEPEVA